MILSFCILGVSHSFAATGVLSSTCSYNSGTDVYSCGNSQEIKYNSGFLADSLDITLNFYKNTNNNNDASELILFRYGCYGTTLCATGGFPNSNFQISLSRVGATANIHRNRISIYSSGSLIHQTDYVGNIYANTKHRLVWDGTLLQWYVNDSAVVNTTISRAFPSPNPSWSTAMTLFSKHFTSYGSIGYYTGVNLLDTSLPELDCETYTETQIISSPGFTINSYLTGSDTTSLFEEYDVAYTEIYDEMIVNYLDFQTLSTESFSTTGATFVGTTFPLKYPTLSFSAYNSDDADYTIHDGFIFTGGVLNNPPNISENSFEYIKIRDGNDKEIFLEEIIQGKKYMIPGGVKDVEFKFKRSWYQVFDTYINFDFQFINYTDVEVEKTFCVNPETLETYIDGVPTDYTDIDDIPKTTSDVEIIQGDMVSEPSVDSWTGTTSTISLDTFGVSYETDPKCSVENSRYKWDSYSQLALVDKLFLPIFNTLIVPIKCYFLTFSNIFDYKSGFDFALPFIGTLEKGNPLGEAVGIAFVFLATISFFKLLPNSKN